MLSTATIILLTTVISFLIFLKSKFTYYSNKGLYSPKPYFYLKKAKRALLNQQSFQLFWAEMYNDIKSRKLQHGGVYLLTTPTYVPVNLEIIKSILQTDFQHFVGHGVYVNEEADPLGAHLFNLTGDKWRNLRAKLTPAFTTGKIKMMFNTLTHCADELKNVLNEAADRESCCDLKEILKRFTMDVIASCAFGLECNSLQNPDSEFATYGKSIFSFDFMIILKHSLQLIFSEEILEKFNISLQKPDVTEFFRNLTEETIKYREENNIYRKDLMHLLLQLKNRGELVDDGKLFSDGEVVKENTLTVNEVAAQVYGFFAAGFDTSSTTMTFALLELAQRPDLQEKLRAEIETVLESNENKLTYEAVQDLTYMEQVIEETLRKYPPGSVIPRKCNKDYKIPGTDVVIEKGEGVSVSVYGIHHDPDIYPDPEVFDPERFSKENKAARHQFAWLPFGAGPRICIALRLGIVQVKVGLATILRDYEISLNEKTKIPIEFDCGRPFVLSPKEGVWVNVNKIV